MLKPAVFAASAALAVILAAGAQAAPLSAGLAVFDAAPRGTLIDAQAVAAAYAQDLDRAAFKALSEPTGEAAPVAPRAAMIAPGVVAPALACALGVMGVVQLRRRRTHPA
ncbi:hypothetical protein ACQ5SO_15130 [Rhodovulum sp. DZ06]|uniref:hypothetical protein n=1 Tax=Rhodovulum sp. DZ06 TaxID=3425126 RepID=UPI003D34B049